MLPLGHREGERTILCPSTITKAKRILKCLAPSVGAIVIGILTFDYSTKEPALGTNIGRTESNSGMILSNEGAAVGAR